MKVALFIPCYVDQLTPSVGFATLRLLERLGCEVTYDSRQVCCGQPFITAGAVREAKQLARLHLRRFAAAEAVVCPSASCVATVRHRFAELGVGVDEQGKRVRERTFELGEFLVRELGVTNVGARFPHRVALLQSCHGLRELGLGQPSESMATRGPAGLSGRTSSADGSGVTERLLEAVEGLELLRPERFDECCGFGGLFSVALPEISVRMGRDRLQAIARTGAEYVTATDVSCLLHIDGIRRRSDAGGPRPLHLAEILLGEGRT